MIAVAAIQNDLIPIIGMQKILLGFVDYFLENL